MQSTEDRDFIRYLKYYLPQRTNQSVFSMREKAIVMPKYIIKFYI